MVETLSLTKRNLLLFFRNKSEVFFSFLSVIIILGLYVLFLSDLQVLSIEESVGKVEGVKALVNAWVMAGLIAVSTVTLSLGALGRIVADRQTNIINDFLVSPVKRNHIFLSYMLSSLIIAMIISLILIVIAEIYIVNSGGTFLSIISLLRVIGITLLCVLSSSLLMLFIVSFLKNEQTYSLVSTIIGTMIGFVTGAYIPMGFMPKTLQIVSNALPVSQGASLLRKLFLEDSLKDVFKNSKAISEYSKTQGIDLYFGDYELKFNFMILFIIGSIVLFAILNIIRFRKMRNK
jgi:multidrug/hemolysin transport system permease protein